MGDHLQKTKTCSLMSDSQCEVFDPCSGHCQCGDMGCPDDTNPAPPGKACAAPIGFQKNHIHWTCHNTGISTGEIPNPYSPSKRFSSTLKSFNMERILSSKTPCFS